MKLDAWKIYLWENIEKKAYEGGALAVTRDGVKEIYTAGWLIEEDPEAKKNKEVHQKWRAKNRVKELLNNTLNAINLYGKKVLDNKGNVDWEKFQNLEASGGYQAAKIKLDIDDLYHLRKFPTKEITMKQAIAYNFKT